MVAALKEVKMILLDTDVLIFPQIMTPALKFKLSGEKSGYPLQSKSYNNLPS